MMVTARDSIKIHYSNQPVDELHNAIERVFGRSQVPIKACKTPDPNRFFVVFLYSSRQMPRYTKLLHY